jgi:hypothetical protein
MQQDLHRIATSFLSLLSDNVEKRNIIVNEINWNHEQPEDCSSPVQFSMTYVYGSDDKNCANIGKKGAKTAA